MSFGGIYQWKRRRAMEDELQRLAESTCAFVLDENVSAWQCGEGLQGHPLFFEGRAPDDDESLLLFLRERCWGGDEHFTVPFDAAEALEDARGYRLFG